MTWVPDACTLPTAQVPLRLNEFDALFVRSLREVTRPEPRTLRLAFADEPGLEAAVGDLAARESACCSFFAFTQGRTVDGLVEVTVQVPAGREPVLDGLARQAAAASGQDPA